MVLSEAIKIKWMTTESQAGSNTSSTSFGKICKKRLITDFNSHPFIDYTVQSNALLH
jgi:hypothetical protein